MTCPRCQQDNPTHARFCLGCGAPLALACGSCGAGLPGGARFCLHCGQPVTAGTAAPVRSPAPETYTPKHLAEKILTSKAALEGERKQITVLFADLKGSMELLVDRDPEEARKLLDPVLERMIEAVHRYEGTVNQVMGDGIMALFGAPVAHEDHAVRACYAALRMQESVKKYAEESRRAHGVEVQIRVGLNSGEVVVRSIGSDLAMDYTAVGQTTHLAARMEQLALPGTIRIPGDTLALVEGYVAVKPLGPVPVKGFADAVEVYEVTGAGPARTRLQATARRGLTRFVGREGELEQLRRAQQLAATGHGQVVAVVGEAGVGKSRLVYEFTHSHRLHGWLTLESASVSYGKATSYLPVIDLLKGYFKIQGRDDLREIREKVTGKLLTLDESLKPTLPALLSLLDVPVDDAAWRTLDPTQWRQQTVDAVRRLLLREGREQPLLLIFEDLHWIDSETQALLNTLVESLGSARLLLLVNYRPEYQHAWGSKTHYSQMRLDALPAETAGELLDALLGDDPGLASLKQLLVKRGNPFFLEETVRTLVETKALAGDPGRYRLAQPIQTIQVPSTVQAMLAARIDRLPPEDKRLLQMASVVGKDVPFALLQAIADLPDETLSHGLARLQAAEYLYETSLFPELEYTFKHALTYEVAYASLPQERRRSLHGRIVEALEAHAGARPAERVDQLAYHAFRGEVWDKAVAYLRQAGARALARSANREAVACLEQALAALTHLPDSRQTLEQAIDLRSDLRPPLLQLGRLQEALSRSQEAGSLAERLGDEQRLGWVYSYLINYHYLKGQPELAIEYGERCLAISQAGNDLTLQAIARWYMGHSYHAQGRYRQAESILMQSIELFKASRQADHATLPNVSYVASSGWLALTLAERGEYDLARAHLDDAQRAAAASGNVYSQAIASSLTGFVWIHQGHLERAVQQLEQSLETCRKTPLPMWQPIPSALLGLALSLLGRVDEGLRLMEDGVTLSDQLGVKAYLALWTTHLGEGLLAAGVIDRALTVAQRALDLAVTHKERGHQAWALRLLGELASRGDPPEVEKAEAFYRQAITLAQELEMRPLLARCHLGLGRLYARRGDRPKAEEHRGPAVAEFRRMNMQLWLEQSAADSGRD